jgi:hypothetical protein
MRFHFHGLRCALPVATIRGPVGAEYDPAGTSGSDAPHSGLQIEPAAPSVLRTVSLGRSMLGTARCFIHVCKADRSASTFRLSAAALGPGGAAGCSHGWRAAQPVERRSALPRRHFSLSWLLSYACSSEQPRTVLEPFAIRVRDYVLKPCFFTGPELHEISSSLSKRNSVIRPRGLIRGVHVLAIILPKTDRADQIFASFRECDVVATRTQVTRCRVGWLVPLEVACHLAKLIARALTFLWHRETPPANRALKV